LIFIVIIVVVAVVIAGGIIAFVVVGGGGGGSGSGSGGAIIAGSVAVIIIIVGAVITGSVIVAGLARIPLADLRSAVVRIGILDASRLARRGSRRDLGTLGGLALGYLSLGYRCLIIAAGGVPVARIGFGRLGLTGLLRLLGEAGFALQTVAAVRRRRRFEEVRLRTLRKAVLDVRERRQILELPEPEVVEKLLGRTEHRRLSGHIAMTDHSNPVALHQRADDVRADCDAANFLDLGTRDRLPIRDQRERLEQCAGISRSPLLPKRR